MKITPALFSRYPDVETFLAKHAGERLGAGSARRVYKMVDHPSYVVKHEPQDVGTFQNVAEWLLWSKALYMSEGVRWLAPCAAISPCGTVLVQKRTKPLPLDERPTHIPLWMTDPKIENWGRFEGRPVMHDYGLTLLSNAIQNKRLKKLVDYV